MPRMTSLKNLTQINNLVEILNSNDGISDRANCFNAIELFWQDTSLQKFLGPEDFIIYIRNYFTQISSEEHMFQGDTRPICPVINQ